MAKKEKTELIQVSKELQSSLDILSSVKEELDLLGNNMLQISVMDETTLSIAQQNLSSANSLLKSIEDKRKALKDPYLQAGKLIDSTCAEMIETAEKGIEHVKTQIKMWELRRIEEAKKAQEELLKKQQEEAKEREAAAKRKIEQREFYNKVIASLEQMYLSSKTAEQCEEKIEYINKNFPTGDMFGDLATEAATQAQNYIKLLSEKANQFKHADTLSESEKQLIKEKEDLMAEKNRIALKEAEIAKKEEELRLEAERKKAEEEAEKERLRLQQEAEMNKTRGIRQIWKFELVDKTKLSQDWITVDTEKVKEYMKVNKDNLNDGEVLFGVRFYKDQSVSA